MLATLTFADTGTGQSTPQSQRARPFGHLPADLVGMETRRLGAFKMERSRTLSLDIPDRTA